MTRSTFILQVGNISRACFFALALRDILVTVVTLVTRSLYGRFHCGFLSPVLSPVSGDAQKTGDST